MYKFKNNFIMVLYFIVSLIYNLVAYLLIFVMWSIVALITGVRTLYSKIRVNALKIRKRRRADSVIRIMISPIKAYMFKKQWYATLAYNTSALLEFNAKILAFFLGVSYEEYVKWAEEEVRKAKEIF